MKYQLMCGDCLELLPKLAPASIDLILTDPPYGTTDCKWDSVIPFEPMWEQLNRVIKSNGAICLFGSEPFSSALRMSNIKNYKYDWIWVKDRSTGFMHAKNSPMKAYENISVFSLGTVAHASLSNNRMVYYPQDLIEIQPKKIVQIRNKNSFITPRKSHKKGYVKNFSNYPKNVLFYDCVNKGIHQTQKPVALLEYLIRTYTIEGETVLDFTMGSGSTGVACVHTNRNFIGIERDKHFYEVSNQRMVEAEEEKRQMLF